jgi:hypothetical protein
MKKKGRLIQPALPFYELRAYPKNVFAPSRPDMNVRAIHPKPSEDG